MPLVFLLLVLLAVLCGCNAAETVHVANVAAIDARTCPEAAKGTRPSSLFGCSGAQYDPRGRLMDWSHAGYAGSERPIPDVPVVLDVVKDLGAKGDNKTDDTAAFVAGLKAAAGKGALYVPAGVYRITAPLFMNVSNTVIRGAGSDKTTLWFPYSLTDLFGNSWNIYNSSNSDYCWGSAFIHVEPPVGAPWPSDKTAATLPVHGSFPKGSTSLGITLPEGRAPSWLKEGEWVMLRLDPSRPGFAEHLLGGLMEPGELMAKSKGILLPVKIKQVDTDGKQVVLNRQLPFEVRAEWGAVFVEWQQPLREVGVEGLSLVFKDQHYNGHHAEMGYNGVFFNHATHSWVRDVRVHNADNGVLFKQSYLNTATDIKITSMPRQPLSNKHGGHIQIQNGHIGLGGKGGADNLYTRFNISTTMCHDLVIDSEILSVFSSGTGYDITPDHHRLCPYGTLWTDINVGSGARLLDSSGPPPAGPHACAYTTFWNIRTSKPVVIDQTLGLRRVPIPEYGPLVNLVGVHLSIKPQGRHLASQFSWHMEHSVPGGSQVYPPNLHEAQLALVRGSLHRKRNKDSKASRSSRARRATRED